MQYIPENESNSNSKSEETWNNWINQRQTYFKATKEWYNENPEANKFLKEETRARNEKIQDSLDNAYEILINEAPAISKEFIKLLKSDKIKPYTKSELFGNFFRIIERGWSDKNLNEMLQQTKERIDSLESGRSPRIYEFPEN